MKQIEIANVLHHTELAPGIFDLRLAAPGICGAARPGQFVEVYLDDGAHMLPRPISICELENGVLRLVYQAVGAGTKALSKKQAGESLRLLGPLGNGFAPAGEKHILVAGGIGAPPLLGLARRLSGEKQVFLGFRSQPFLAEEFERAGCTVHIATDDGSVGFCGNAVELARPVLARAGYTVYACGPRPMLRALAALRPDAQISMEERMACGFGVCVGCVIPVRDESGAGVTYRKVCKDGPVFAAKEVVWDV